MGTETAIVCSVKHRTAYLPGQDGRWQLPDITAALLLDRHGFTGSGLGYL